MGKSKLVDHPIEDSLLLGGTSTKRADWDFKELSKFLSLEAPEWLAELRESKSSGHKSIREFRISED